MERTRGGIVRAICLFIDVLELTVLSFRLTAKDAVEDKMKHNNHRLREPQNTRLPEHSSNFGYYNFLPHFPPAKKDLCGIHQVKIHTVRRKKD